MYRAPTRERKAAYAGEIRGSGWTEFEEDDLDRARRQCDTRIAYAL